MKPRALDLFCGAGGATRGLQLAGFHVTGVDIKPQPRYCGNAFLHADAMTFPLAGYDFIWASPPCQAHSVSTLSQRKAGAEYPDLIGSLRHRLAGSRFTVIENVPGAPLQNPILLCGSYFGLRLTRHRYFELSFATNWLSIGPCRHHKNPVTIAGHGTPTWARRRNGGKGFTLKERYEAMGIDWMDRDSLSLAIPPAYSEFIGRRAMRAMGEFVWAGREKAMA